MTMNMNRRTILVSDGGFGLAAALMGTLSKQNVDVVLDEGHREVPIRTGTIGHFNDVTVRGARAKQPMSLRKPGVWPARQSSDPAVREWNARVDAKRADKLARRGR